MKAASYPMYKDSGVEWLGQIPAHWQPIPVKRVARIVNGATPRSSDPECWNGDIAWATPDDLGQLKGDTLQDTSRHITEKGYASCGTSLVPGGSLLLSTRAPIGHLAIAERAMCMNQGCRGLVPSDGAPSRYRYYSILAAKPVLQSRGQGSTFQELSRDSLGSIPVPNPSRDEQQTIADFLDRETAKINALAEKKEKLIELLQEKRTALITHAVTKGLDPNAPMKDSGIEWLGQIPAHWGVKKFSWLIQASNAGEVIDRGYWGGGNELLYSCQRTPIWSTFDHFPSERRTQAGDLLVTRNGTPYVHLPEPGSIYTNVVQRVQLTSEMTTRFAHTVLSAAASTLIGFGDIIESFNMGTWRQLGLPLPPVLEQQAIALYIDRETAKIDALIAKIREAIERLKEYRTALISAAVTGKIDVREAVQ